METNGLTQEELIGIVVRQQTLLDEYQTFASEQKETIDRQLSLVQSWRDLHFKAQA